MARVKRESEVERGKERMKVRNESEWRERVDGKRCEWVEGEIEGGVGGVLQSSARRIYVYRCITTYVFIYIYMCIYIYT